MKNKKPIILPEPPIPTAFDNCISVEEQILWLRKELEDLRKELKDKGIIDDD